MVFLNVFTSRIISGTFTKSKPVCAFVTLIITLQTGVYSKFHLLPHMPVQVYYFVARVAMD